MPKKKKSEPGAAPQSLRLPQQVGHARARVSVDDPSFSLFSGFGGFSSLSAPNYEQEWRLNSFDDRTLDRIDTPELLLRLVDLSPEISKGLWDFLRFANAGWEVKAFRLGGSDAVEDTRATALVEAFLDRLNGLYGSVDVVINRLFISAFLRGAFFAELVFDARGREPVDIATPDPRWVLFERRADPVRGDLFVPYQQQRGKRVYLDGETVRYVPVDPAPGSPFGRALASPAIFTTLFAMGLLRDLRRVVAQQGYPRLDISIDMEALNKWAPAEVRTNPEEMKRWVDGMIRQIETEYAELQPEDIFIHTSTITFGRPVGTIDSSSLGAVDGLMRALERNLSRALKSAPFLFGLSESTTETQANRQYEALLAGIKSVQHLCEHLLEHLLTLALAAQGIAARVKWRFAEVRAAEMMRDTEVEREKTMVAALRYALGYWSQDEAAAYATGKEKAELPEPLAIPNTLSLLAPPAAVEEPAAVDAPSLEEEEGDTDEEEETEERRHWLKALRTWLGPWQEGCEGDEPYPAGNGNRRIP